MDDTTDIETNLAETSRNYTEKCDISPEYIEKSSSDASFKPSSVEETISNRKTSIGNNKLDDGDNQMSEGTSIQNKNSGFAFTIDLSEGKTVDKRKLKEMAEHFQNRQLHQQEKRRHRRGVSLSKLEDCRKSSSSLDIHASSSATLDDSGVPSAMNKPPFKHRNSVSKIDHSKNDGSIGLRVPRITSTSNNNNQDSSKRHSWSPRSSLGSKTSSQISNVQVPTEKTLKYIENMASFQPKSKTLQRTMGTLDCNTLKLASKSSTSNRVNRSLVAESSVDRVVTTPLEYLRSSDDEISLGDTSQATYTLDGDNYTEEEKERMSIDKFNRSDFNLSIDSISTRGFTEKNSSVRNSCDSNRDSKQSQRKGNYNEKEQLTSQKSAKFYLDKLKFRVKSIGDRKFQNSNKKELSINKLISSQFENTNKSPGTESCQELDHGTFTSVTACGVLKENGQMENSARSNGDRRLSLTKYQIDSSEYVQSKVDESLMRSYTDYEKAMHNEYKLNIFSSVSSHISTETSPGQTDDELVTYGNDESISIKTAQSKNDWIQEWAKNARRCNNILPYAEPVPLSPRSHHYSKTNWPCPQSEHSFKYVNRDRCYDVACFNQIEQFGGGMIDNSGGECLTIKRDQVQNWRSPEKFTPNIDRRPPISTTKIPSPMHTHNAHLRARSSSANRSFRQNNAESDRIHTEMYLEKTAAAISSLQEIHKKNSSPKSASNSSASRHFASDFNIPQNSYENSVNFRSNKLHKRNSSLDARMNDKLEFYDSGALFGDEGAMDHVCQNSYECKQNQLSISNCSGIDQTNSSSSSIENHRAHNYSSDVDKRGRSAHRANKDTFVSNESPIRRSNSFCNRNVTATIPKSSKKAINRPNSRISPLQKSASNSSIRNISAAVPRHQQHKTKHNEILHINDIDNLHATCDETLFLTDESHDMKSPSAETRKHQHDRQKSEPPISNTRYNKAFLIRMEQNRQTNNENRGVQACPNTPELSRKAFNFKSSRDPKSVPRDSSLSRMKQALPNLQTTKKTLTQDAAKDSSSSISSSAKQRILPKYMDISKYKPVQGQSFLKRDESKSTLVNRNEIRKSPSATHLRSSCRVKSAGAKSSTPNTPNTKDSKARELELAMWKRRATYDPMKSAAEGRKKLEAKKASNESNVLRSQSFHSGVGQFNSMLNQHEFKRDSLAVTSTESSEEEEEDFDNQ